MEALKIKFEIANVKPYELSEEQQHILNEQVTTDKKLYTDAESIYTDLKKKYEL
jgi:hypothetical protein